uniref:Vigilin n=1 Tax=Cyprinus carpio carpio TaxID=630221 RepID=A0A8C1BFS3_CYPCA
MSSVAVLTQESFAEHRSGLKDVDITEDEAYIPTYLEAFPPLPDKGTPGEKTGEPARAWSKIRPIKASVITQVFHVPLEERRYKDNSQFGEGEEAKVCLDIMQKTGAHIELSLAKDQGLSIMVTGKLDSVMKARKEIVARLQTQASATVLIPKEHHRFVIGKNGEKLQELELKTATKIAIPRSDDPNANIRISGTKDGIEKARHEIQLISAEQDKRAVERLSFEKAFHPFIAGAYNRLVQELSQETGARISIPPPSIPKDEIVITGEKEAVAMAIARIRAIYEEKKCKTTTISVEVKKSQHKYIVGPKGNTLQEILENTGVSVEMPPLDSSSETIILRGEPDKLGPALTQVYAKAKSVIVVEVIAPAWLHRFIIGKKGQNISRITQQLPKVHIEFTDGEERISLEGPTEEVEQAQAQIQEIIKDLMARMDYAEINIDQRFHRHLIGKNGANINRIKEQYKVSVRIPQDSERCGLVRIEGDPQGVQLARKELMDMAQRMENERTKDLIIEQKFHRTIIGQKGEKIKEVRDKFPEVIIIFPDQQQKSDIVQLRGPKNEVEKCAKFLQKLIAELVESSFSISVPIHKQFHKNIIGKGGANIKKIREETNTKIDLPTENSNSEMIVITGKKSSCEAARDRILAIQKELANLKEAEVSIPAKLHNSLIGSKGSLVRSVMEECGGVHIHFPAEGSGLDKVTIRGPAEEVERARRQLLQLAEEKPSWDPKAAEYNKLHGNMKFRSNFQTEMSLQVSSLHSQRLFFSLLKDDYDIYELYYFLYLWLAAQEAASQENGDTDLIPRKCDIITVMGRAEKCELARAALLALVPVTIDVEVSFDLHRYIIGQKGAGIRKMMEEYEVNIWVPQPEQQSDIIKITGQVASVERAKQGLLERVKELQAEQEDRALRSYKVTLSVDPKYHPKIIGRKGAVISQIRKDYDVNVQFPDKGDEQQDVIVISGYERSANEARAAIEQLVAALQDMVSEDIRLDRRVHARIIGARGKAIRKLMEEFKVDIRFPQPGSEDPSKVTVTGLPENVDNAIDHLLNLEEEYMLSVTETETMAAYLKPPSKTMGTGGNDEDNKALAKGFVVRDAPWNAQGNKAPDMSSAEEFPTFGSGIAPKQTASAWGPKKC